MQWYQMFEYALGHWLQKSTEHVLGCVLCSPGCFSLFRGEALMSDNVMNTYTTVSTQPKHYIQYDQGEDRWLCTLLLQQGWRVEYSAASGKLFLSSPSTCRMSGASKGRRFSEKDWYYLQAQTDMPFHYLKLIV
jgi:cellulose synthase/poly-beta-1,6-N-acetylglucosamine synthase-like glycosyltransferase